MSETLLEARLDRLPVELLTGVPAVLAAAEEGSATRAAAVLHTTTATVLRRIEKVGHRRPSNGAA